MTDTEFNENTNCFWGALWSYDGLYRCPWQKGGCQGFWCPHWSIIEWMLPQKGVPVVRWLSFSKAVPVATLQHWAVCQYHSEQLEGSLIPKQEHGWHILKVTSEKFLTGSPCSSLSFFSTFLPDGPVPVWKAHLYLETTCHSPLFVTLSKTKKSHIDFARVAWLVFYWKTILWPLTFT